MAPRSSLKKSSRRPRVARESNSYEETAVISRKRRWEHDIIEGLDIYSFNDELELEYFSNVEEPLPRKIRRFRGFDETEASVDLIKKVFEKFVKNFISPGKTIDNPLTSTAIQPREVGNTDKTIDSPRTSTAIQPREEGSLEKLGDPYVISADEEASVVLVDNDEKSLNATDNIPDVVTTGPVDSRSVQIEENALEVITINDSDSDDDDVILLSDPKAPVPQPVRDCVCPNCGKVKRTEPIQKGRIATGAQHGRATRPNDLSSVVDEVLIITDEDIPVKPGEAPVPATLQLDIDPTQLEEAPLELEDVPVRPQGVATRHKNVSALPEDVMVRPDDAAANYTEPHKGKFTSESDTQLTAIDEGAVITEELIVIMDDDVPVQRKEVEVPPKNVSVQHEYEPTRQKELLAQSDELPAPRIGKPLAASGDESQPKESSAELGEISAPRIRKPVTTASGNGSPLKYQLAELTALPGELSALQIAKSGAAASRAEYVLKSQLKELSAQLVELSTPRIRKPVALASGNESPLRSQLKPLSAQPYRFSAPRIGKLVVAAASGNGSAPNSQLKLLSAQPYRFSAPRIGKPIIVAAASGSGSTPKSQVKELSAQPDELSAPRIRKPVTITSGNEPPLRSQLKQLSTQPDGLSAPRIGKPVVAAASGNGSPPNSRLEELSAGIGELSAPRIGKPVVTAASGAESPLISRLKELSAQPGELSASLVGKSVTTASGTGSPLKCQLKQLPARTDELSAPLIRKPAVTTSANESSLIPLGVRGFTNHSGPLSSCPSLITPVGQKPASRQIKNRSSVPGTVKLILPESGKTVILKLDGAKSKMLPPSTKNPLIRTFHVAVPQNELQSRVSVPGVPDKNKAVGAQTSTTATRHAGMPSALVSSGRQEVLTRSSQSPVKQQAVRKLDSGKISADNSLKGSYLTLDSGKIKLLFPNKNKVDDSNREKSPVSEVASVSVGDPTTTNITSSKPLVVESATRSVVRDLVDFVCRNEIVPRSYPYDQKRSETPCLSVPCGELRCRLGCICISLAKKTVRRVRCKNASCIFGCDCMSHGAAHPANRYGKTIRNEIMGVSRRKQVLTVLPCRDLERSGMSFDSGSAAQAALKSFLSVQKAVDVSGSQQSDPDRNSGFRHGPTSQPAAKSLHQRLPPDLPAPKVLGTPKSTSFADSKPSWPSSANGPSASVAQPRRCFGREKIPIPERALVCLTPGLGYVPLVETTPKVTLLNPFKPGSTKSFIHIREATEWLNSSLHTIFIAAPALRWVVADKSTIEKKQLHRLSIDALKSPNCTVSRSGPVFTS